MAYYLLQVAYTPESFASQMKNPQNVVERTKSVIESLGGKLLSTYYAFGEYDLVQTMECPDSVSAAAVAMVAAAGGAIKATKIIPLLSVEEGQKALKKAATIKYKAPA
jgi:uncharacterized protein with GYD domain